MFGKWIGAAIAAAVMALSAMAPMAMAEEYGAPYPRLSASDIEPCRGLMTTLKSQTASYYRAQAQAYAPGGKYYNLGYADGGNTRAYNGLADSIDSDDAVSWWVKGINDDGMGFGGLDDIYNNGSPNVDSIAKGAKNQAFDGSTIQPFVLDHQVGNLYSFADGNPTGTCVDRVYMAKYEALHANDTAETGASGDCFSSREAAIACFNRDVAAWQKKYPQPGEDKGARAVYQYSYFMGDEAIKMLSVYKSALGSGYQSDYDGLAATRKSGHDGCNALSSTNVDCPLEYPK